MEVRHELVAACPAERLFGFVEDLSRYPAWMGLIHEVAVAEPAADGLPVWEVELRAQVGPFARSKRLRMMRTSHDPPSSAVFERAEIDGRAHAAWVLRVDLSPRPPDGDTTELVMTLNYGGRLWTGGVLQRVLDDQIRRGSEALAALVIAEPKH